MSQRANGDFLRGSTDLMVLSVLADGPKYGYLIQQRLTEVSNGRVDLKAGTPLSAVAPIGSCQVSEESRRFDNGPQAEVV